LLLQVVEGVVESHAVPLYRQVYPKDNYYVGMDHTDEGWRGKADLVYGQLRADIESGALAPGQTLAETELVTYTGASRTPVREAVRRLASEGLIDLEPRRAPTVSRISLRSARALFDFRRILEPAAIRLVAGVAQSNATLLQAITELRERFVELGGQEYSPEFADRFTVATGDFDHLLATNTPNEYLSRSISDLRPHSARLRHIAHTDRSRLHESIKEHLLMCDAVIAGDADAAADAMAKHLQHVDQAIFRRLLASVDADLLVS